MSRAPTWKRRGPGLRGWEFGLGVGVALAVLGGLVNATGAGTLTLTWVDNSTTEDGFSIERRVSGDPTFAQLAVVGPKVTNYVDSTAAAGTTYCYRVSAFNAAGVSPPSNEACSAPAQAATGGLSLVFEVAPAEPHAGDAFTATLTVINSGAAQLVDVYAGVAVPPQAGPGLGCPRQDAVAFLADGFTRVVVTCLSAPLASFPRLARNVQIPGNWTWTGTLSSMSFVWSAGLPAGPYVFFIAATRPGAFLDGTNDPGDGLAIAAAAVTFQP